MPEIISASRRTDIPAFYSGWFLNRLREGYCEYWHVFSKRWFRVSLLPEDVLGFVFWTKNLGPLLPDLPEIREHSPFYVQFTINAYPLQIEPNVIGKEVAVAQLRSVAADYGVGSVVWRFDPIVHTQFGGPAQTVARFRGLCRDLEGAARVCIVSFMSPYRRQAQAFARAGIIWDEASPELRRELSAELAEVAAQHGITLAACCNDDVVATAVVKAHCIDPGQLRLAGAEISGTARRAPSREHCGCYRSLDIGAFDTCTAGCVYCYANQNAALAERNRASHDSTRPALRCVGG